MGLGAAYIVAAACIGYFFCSNCYRFKYELARKSGYYSYLHCTSFGVLFMVVAMSISLDFLRPQWFTFRIDLLKHVGFQKEFVVDVVSSFLLSLAASKLINYFVSKSRAVELAWKDDLSNLLNKAIEFDKPVQISLDTRKVYVGQVFDTLEPDDASSFLTIVPLYSGYRAEDSLELRITHRYEKIIADLKERSPSLESYRLVIPKSKIVTCHIFDIDIYNQTKARLAVDSALSGQRSAVSSTA